MSHKLRKFIALGVAQLARKPARLIVRSEPHRQRIGSAGTDESGPSARLEEGDDVTTSPPRPPQLRRTRDAGMKVLALAVASAALVACLGEIGDGDGKIGGGTGPGGGPGGENPPGGTADKFTPSASRLHKLTRTQYLNSLRDVLGGPITIAKDAIEDDSEKNGFVSIAMSSVSISSRGIEQYEAAAYSAAKQVLENATRKTAFVGCTPAGTTDAACTKSVLTKFGRRAWRRPLTDEELTKWVSIATDAQTKLTSFYEGLEIAVTGMLASPHFLYRVEIGEPDPEHEGWLKYTNYEMASRLSFFLKNTTPDDTLLDAAEKGELSSADGIKAHVTRLLADTASRAAFDGFFSELLQLQKLDTISRDKTKFPLMTATLGASMHAETLALFEDVAFTRDADLRDLFDSQTTFVNAELAAVYGLSGVTGTALQKITLPSDGIRVGILGQAGFLAVNSHVGSSSPTYRGKAIRERFLCESMPPPPDNVPPLPEPGTGERATARQRLEMHRKVEPCKSCHQLMDPIGLGFENFDAIGAFRDKENAVTIDPSGDLDGKPFANPKALASLLKADPRTAPCLARSLYRHASGHVEQLGETIPMNNIVKTFEGDGYRLRALALAIATSDAFRYATASTGDM